MLTALGIALLPLLVVIVITSLHVEASTGPAPLVPGWLSKLVVVLIVLALASAFAVLAVENARLRRALQTEKDLHGALIEQVIQK